MQIRKRARARQRRKELQKLWHQHYVRVFTYIFAALLAIGILLIPIRPKQSDLEKRELEKFPAPSISGILNGSWFSGIDTWFSDTFPFREQLLTCEAYVEMFYGLKGEEIYGVTGQGDEIPQTTELAPILLPSAAPEPAEDASAQSAPDGTSDPAADAIAEPTPEAVPELTAEPTAKLTPKPTKTPAPDGTVRKKGEVAGTVYIAANRGFEIYYFSNDSAIYYASMLNTVHAILGDRVTIYDMIAPTSFGVCLSEATQAALGGSNTKDAINYTYSMLDPAIQRVSVLEALVDHNAEYIYFNTDHHWTALGAYYAYREFCQVRGFTPHELSEFKESQYKNFLGTFYSASNQSESLRNNSDVLYTYTPIGTNDCTISDNQGYSYNFPVVDDASDYTAGSKYSCFIGGDNALTTINNPGIADGSSCVVVKESYGNAFVPFLVDHYQTVYIVDYRYYSDNLTNFILQNNIRDLIFLNTSDAILQSNAETMMSLFQ